MGEGVVFTRVLRTRTSALTLVSLYWQRFGLLGKSVRECVINQFTNRIAGLSATL